MASFGGAGIRRNASFFGVSTHMSRKIYPKIINLLDAPSFSKF